ncbi:NADH(P)-binding-domain-containing protein [Ilyonectria sp. MPI-CAGE-AT-0026]|nr:NADH(P)-binding-domain-containing protein [Ilyonectria sp. MPI-CAGE-AT-0026]
MRILIVGANGRTGRLSVSEAISRGHTVTALVRNPSSLKPQIGLTIVKGSPLDASSIEDAFKATDTTDQPAAVIIALNSSRASDNPFSKSTSPPRFLAESVTNILAAMENHGVSKLVYTSAFGVGASAPNMPLFLRLLVRYSTMGVAYEDHEEVDEVVKKSKSNWILVRPVVMTDKEKQTVKCLENEGQGVGMLTTITRASVAAFLVDAAESDKWNRTAPVIAN